VTGAKHEFAAGGQVKRPPQWVCGLFVTLDARGELWINRLQRDGSQGQRLSLTLGLPQVGPRRARRGDRREQVIAAVSVQQTGAGKSLTVIEGEIAPPPVAQAPGGRKVAREAEFKARRMGTFSALVGNPDPLGGEVINTRKFPIFCFADFVAAAELLVSQSKVNFVRDRYAGFSAIPQSLKDQYDALSRCTRLANSKRSSRECNPTATHACY
jgi:hypothetical protein